MANEVKSKIVSINGSIKTKEVDGERRIVFVASSASIDRHYEQVNVASLRLPLKGGGDITVEAIPAEGVAEIIDIPLMLNHSGDVRDVIGSVRSAYFSNGELIFEAGISSRDVAQEMLTLIEEKHLSNAFSITMIDYDYDFETETISKAEVIEVSLVYRGSNKEARLVAIKSLIGGNNMSEAIKKQNDVFGDATGDGEDHNRTTAPVEETPKEETTTETETTETTTPDTEEASVETPESEIEVEAPAETEPVEETTETNSNSNPEEDKAMNKQIAKDTVVEKTTQPVQSSKSVDYLSTKAALKDFQAIVLKHHKGDNRAIMKEWMGHLKEKAITGDAILPARIEQIFFKTWADNPGLLGTLRQLNARAGAVYAMTSDDKAKGHKKGEKKADQEVEAVRRDLKALAIYKKLPIDMQDLFDDETGELLAFRAEELAAHVGHAVAIGAILGVGTGNDATKQGARGLFPMIDDINATTGYGTNVATKVTGVTGDKEFELAVRAAGAVKDINNAGKILVVPTGFKTALRLAKNDNNSLKFPIGMNIAEALEVKAIYEIDELVGNAVKAIVYVDQSYVLVGDANGTVRTDFDIDYNQDIMLIERYSGGSQQGYKTLAGAVSA